MTRTQPTENGAPAANPDVRAGAVIPDPGLVLGGTALAASAGYVNVASIELLGFPGSHITGLASHLSEALAGHAVARALFLLGVLLSFAAGAAFSGYVIGNQTLKPGRRYGLVLMVEGTILAAAALSAAAQHGGTLLWIAFAMGLQNAMATSYRGMVIRTTHVTGVVTDLGLMFGHLVRRDTVRPLHAMLLTAILTGFLIGGMFGFLAIAVLGAAALWPPAVWSLVSGVAYWRWRIARQRAA